MDNNKLNEESVIENKKNTGKKSVLMEWGLSLVIAIILAMVIKTFLFEPTRIKGTSMNMTLQDDDRVIVNKIGLKFRALQRGDIIVMKFDEKHDYIKRVIGVPGENVQIIDGKVYINGKVLDEPYIYGDFTESINGFEWKLKEDEYFVMGDNRKPGGSTDSRVFGPVNINRIKGVASFRFYPFNNIGLVK